MADGDKPPASSDNDKWFDAIHLLTGFKPPARGTVFNDLYGNDDIPLMKVEIHNSTATPSNAELDAINDLSWRTQNSGWRIENTDFVVPFYSGMNGAVGALPIGSEVQMRKARITLLGTNAGSSAPPAGGVDMGGQFGDHSGSGLMPSGFKGWDSTPLANYSYGGGLALEQLLNAPYTTHGWGMNGQNVADADVVDVNTFERAAEAFDRASLFFFNSRQTIQNWENQLGQEDAAWRGKAAGVFWDMIHQLGINYQNYSDAVPLTFFQSQVGFGLRMAKDGFVNAIRNLHSTWSTWALYTGNPLRWLHDILLEVTDDIWYNNITKVRYKYDYYSEYDAGHQEVEYDGFRANVPAYGNLDDLSTWKAIGEEAIKRWQKSVQDVLEVAGKQAMIDVNNAFVDIPESLHVLTTTQVNLLSDYQGDKAAADQDAAKAAQDKADAHQKEMEDKQAKDYADSLAHQKEQEDKQAKDYADGLAHQKEQEDKQDKQYADSLAHQKEQEDKQAKDYADSLTHQKEQEDKQQADQKQQQDLQQKQYEQQQADQKQQQDEQKAEQKQQQDEQKKQYDDQMAAQAALQLKQEKKQDEQQAKQDQQQQHQEDLQKQQEAEQKQQYEEQRRDQQKQQDEQQAKQDQQQKHQEDLQKQQEAEQKKQYDQQRQDQQQQQEEQKKQQQEQEALAKQQYAQQQQTQSDYQKKQEDAQQKQQDLQQKQYEQQLGQYPSQQGNGQLQSLQQQQDQLQQQLGNGAHGQVGSQTHLNPDGTVTTDYSDGSSTTIDPHTGLETTTHADGSVTTDHLTGGHELTNPDGSQTTVNKDGTVTTHYPDGSVTTVNPQTGTATTHEPDGQTVTTPLGGGATLPHSSYANLGSGPQNYQHELYDSTPYAGSLGSPGYSGAAAGAPGPGISQSGGVLPLGTRIDGTTTGGGLPAGGAPMGGGGMPMMGGMGGMGGGGASSGTGERVREVYDDEDVVTNGGSLGRRGGTGRRGYAEEEAAASGRRNSTSSAYDPFTGGEDHERTQSGDRERDALVPEEEDVWGTDEGGAPAVIGG
ncbi:MAG: hypothetical protein JWP48_2354 [Actinoallomurus sp.]|nr:hypothetical protein [Actinoallomurus sp.]